MPGIIGLMGLGVGFGALLSACDSNEFLKPVDPSDSFTDCFLDDETTAAKEIMVTEALDESARCSLSKRLDWFRENSITGSYPPIQGTREGVMCFRQEDLIASQCFPSVSSDLERDLTLCASANVYLSDVLGFSSGDPSGSTCTVNDEFGTLCAGAVIFDLGPNYDDKPIAFTGRFFTEADQQRIDAECY